MCSSLRWHDPDQVRRSKRGSLPLSPAHRTPVVVPMSIPRRAARYLRRVTPDDAAPPTRRALPRADGRRSVRRDDRRPVLDEPADAAAGRTERRRTRLRRRTDASGDGDREGPEAARRRRAHRASAWVDEDALAARAGPARATCATRHDARTSRSSPICSPRAPRRSPLPRRACSCRSRHRDARRRLRRPRLCSGRCTPSRPTIAAVQVHAGPGARRRAAVAGAGISAAVSVAGIDGVARLHGRRRLRSRASRRSSPPSLVLDEMPLAARRAGPGVPLHRGRPRRVLGLPLRGASRRSTCPVGGTLTRVPAARGHAHRLGEQLRRPPRRQPLAVGRRLRERGDARGSTAHGVPGITIVEPTGIDSAQRRERRRP